MEVDRTLRIREVFRSHRNDGADLEELWRSVGEEDLFGLLGRAIAERSPELMDQHRVMLDELVRLGVSGAPLRFLTQGWIIHCLERLANNGFHEQVLTAVKKGAQVGSFCLTEPSYGSDYSNLKTSAAKTQGGWRLDGGKTFITNGACADFYITVANTSTEDRSMISLFLVPRDMPGIRSVPLGMKGNESAGIATITFSGVELEDIHLLGSAGTGLYALPRLLQYERIDVALCATAMMKIGIEAAVEFLATKRTDGDSMLSIPAIQIKLLDAYEQYQVLSGFMESLVARLLAGRPCSEQVMLAKVHATESTRNVLQELMQLEGGAGFTTDDVVGRLYSDIAPLTVGGGANDVLRGAVFRLLKVEKRGKISL